MSKTVLLVTCYHRNILNRNINWRFLGSITTTLQQSCHS